MKITTEILKEILNLVSLVDDTTEDLQIRNGRVNRLTNSTGWAFEIPFSDLTLSLDDDTISRVLAFITQFPECELVQHNRYVELKTNKISLSTIPDSYSASKLRRCKNRSQFTTIVELFKDAEYDFAINELAMKYVSTVIDQTDMRFSGFNRTTILAGRVIYSSENTMCRTLCIHSVSKAIQQYSGTLSIVSISKDTVACRFDFILDSGITATYIAKCSK